MFLCGVIKAQDTTKYYTSKDYGWQYKRVKVDSSFILPKDTLNEETKDKLNYFINTENILNRTSTNSQDIENIEVTLTIQLENEILIRHFFIPEISVCVNDLIPMKESYIQALTYQYKNEGKDDVSIDMLILSNEHLNYFNALIELVKKKAKGQLENKIKDEEKLNLEFYKIVAKIITECKEKKTFDFVFPVLKSVDFKDIITDDGFSFVNRKQQIIMNNSVKDFNCALVKICEILGIPKITSHYARSSFGSLLIATKGDKAIDLVSLQRALGHSSIQQSVDYITSLSNEGKDELTKSLSDNF
jgi:hypothetical protein